MSFGVPVVYEDGPVLVANIIPDALYCLRLRSADQPLPVMLIRPRVNPGYVLRG